MIFKLIGASLVATAGTLLLTTSLAAQSSWIELKGPRFVLLGERKSDELKSVSCDIDFAARTLAISQGEQPINTIPFVFAVKGANGARELLPQFWEQRAPRPFGAYWSGAFGHHLLVRTDAPRGEQLRRVLHEYSHFITRLQHREPPRWLDEGLAEYWENTIVRDGVAEIGSPVGKHIRTLRADKGWIPIATLLAARELPRDGHQLAHFYAESWALVHLLAKSDGTESRVVVPGPLANVSDDQLKSYARGQLKPTLQINLEDATASPCPDVIARDLSPFEILMAKAKSLADGARPQAALPLLRQALTLSPDNAESLEVMGFVHFTLNEAGEAAALFDKLIAAKRATHISYYYRALLASQLPAVTGESRKVLQIEYLQESLRLKPDFDPARQLLQRLGLKPPLAF